MRILWELKEGARRYGELRRSAIVAARGAPVAPRTLSRELKELQSRGLIVRKQYAVVPPRVEYRLTAAGKSLIPVVKQIVKWGIDHGPADCHGYDGTVPTSPTQKFWAKRVDRATRAEG